MGIYIKGMEIPGRCEECLKIGWQYVFECNLDDVEDRYKVDEGYKVTLKPLDSKHASQHFYQSDFISLIESGHIVEKTNDSFHIEHEEIYIPLTDTTYIVYNGDYITD